MVVFLVLDVSDDYHLSVVGIYQHEADAEKFIADDRDKSCRYRAAEKEAEEKKAVGQRWRDWINIHYPEFRPEYFPRLLEIEPMEVL